MAIPENWTVEQVQLPEPDESMDEQIRGYNQAISRRLLFPLDLVELKEGSELSRDTIFKTLLNTVAGWREEILSAFDSFARVQAKIHGMESASVSHSYPPIEPADVQQLIGVLQHAPLAGLSQREVRQILNQVEGVDLEVAEEDTMEEGQPVPDDAEEQGDRFVEERQARQEQEGDEGQPGQEQNQNQEQDNSGILFADASARDGSGSGK